MKPSHRALLFGLVAAASPAIAAAPFTDVLNDGHFDKQNFNGALSLPAAIPHDAGVGGIPIAAAARSLSRIGPDRGQTRGLRDSQLYKTISPSVVLVVTDSGLGTGSLIDTSGTIVTNLHVIAGAKDVAVVFKPKQEGQQVKESDAVPAQVLRVNGTKDLALIKVASVPEGLIPIKLGTIDDVSVGADVHAIGHPIGEAWTYTKGVVSQVRNGYNWSTDRIKHLANVIQTQTPISPGNSGGPLLNEDGKLIGVNTFKSTEGENLNFAVSVTDLETFLGEKESVAGESLAPPKPKACTEPEVIYKGPNKEGSADLVVVDTLCSGRANSEMILPRDASRPMTLVVFLGDPANSTAVYMDSTRMGKWEYSLWRADPRGPWQLGCQHENGSIKPARCEQYDLFVAQRKTAAR